MSLVEHLDPLALDSTSQLIAQKLQAIANNVKPDATEINMSPSDSTKVATKINTLSDQMAKSVIGDSAVDISANSNLNDYATPGYFRCNSYATAQTITNVPLVCIFTLQVRYGSGTSYAVQEFTDIYTGKLWRRVKQGNDWTSWISADDQMGGAYIRTINNNTSSAKTYTLTAISSFPSFIIAGTNQHVINETVQVYTDHVESVLVGSQSDTVSPVFVNTYAATITLKAYAKVMIIGIHNFSIS